MKSLIVIASLAVLGGCAVAPSGPAYYASAVPLDRSQWHVVSVTPVPPGTGARIAASSGNGAAVEYSSAPVVSQPLYVAQPVYVQPQPSYYYPPVSIGLDFVFGRHWHGGHRGGGRRHWDGHRHR